MARQQVIKNAGHQRVHDRGVPADGHDLVGHRDNEFSQSGADDSSLPHGSRLSVQSMSAMEDCWA